VKDDIVDEFLTRDRGALEEALRRAGAQHFRGSAFRCPFHDDAHASGSMYQGADGHWRAKCHACQYCEDVIGILAKTQNRSSSDVLRERRREAQASPQPTKAQAAASPKRDPRRFADFDAAMAAHPRRQGVYVYADPATGRRDLIVVRLPTPGGGKWFCQMHEAPDGAVIECRPDGLLPLYNRAAVAGSGTVVVAEGEKCVEALGSAGIVATTAPMGAGKARYADWSPLAGKRVYLWPDNDDFGHRHMADVARVLDELEPRPVVYVIDPTPFGIPPKGDAVEFLAEYADGDAVDTARALRTVFDLAKPVGGSESLRRRLSDISAGKMRPVAWPWRMVTALSKALLPGTVTAVCADPGAGKSFFALESFAYWHANGVRAALYMLEDTQDYHLNRIMAQLEENGDYADLGWQAKNGAAQDACYAKHRRELDGMAPYLDATDDPPTYDVLLKWLERRAKQGCRVLCIDPITAAESDAVRPWADDKRFIMRAKAVVQEYGASLVLMTHPRTTKGGKGTLSDMAGGAAFPRFSHTVFWLERHDEPKRVLCAGPVGDFQTSINRTLRLSKTRNGSGAGVSIGFYFDHKLRLAEQGVIRKQTPQGVDPTGGDAPRAPRVVQIQDPFADGEAA
jgi:hypothetical protein